MGIELSDFPPPVGGLQEDAGTRLVNVAFFSDEYAKTLTAKDMAIWDLRDLILSTTAGKKSDLPWLKLATFGDKRTAKGSLRNNDNVISITGIEVDYDGKVMALGDAVSIIKQARLNALLYTSPSYTTAEPKWRILLPTSCDQPPEERAKLVARVNGIFGGVFATESFTLSQAYYYGSVNRNPEHRAEYVGGDYIDLRDDLDAGGCGYNYEPRTPGGEPRADPELVALAMAAIPNNDVSQPDYNKIGMACWAATGGSDEGFKAFDAWARKSKKYHGGTAERWRHYFGSPPNKIGAGTLFYMAHEAQPGWRDAYDAKRGVSFDDFYAYMPQHNYIFAPSREMWPASSINARLGPVPLRYPDGTPVLDEDGEQKKISASRWLDQHKPVEQMTWAPGLPMLVRDCLIADGGWIERKGVACFNLYRPPTIELGNAAEADRWLEHVHKVFGDDDDHIVKWLSHRVQRPQDKINHALVLGGDQGIGKDTMLEPAKHAVGPWNFSEVSPQHMLGRFNGFLKSVILRVSEARDLGEINRFSFYDHMKAYTAAPPDVLRVDEKNLREHSILNCCGVIITTNYKSNGIYLPADDRRHYVAFSGLTKKDFTENYWNELWGWYAKGGIRHVAAYLAEMDISDFDPKAPPPKTAAFWAIVDANRAPEDAELADVLDKLGNPDATTIAQITTKAGGGFFEWITDRKNRRVIPHRLESCGYVPARNDGAKDGLWKIEGARQAVYVKADLSISDRLRAASGLTR